MSKRTANIVTAAIFAVILAGYAIKAARSRAFDARMGADKVDLLTNFKAILTTDPDRRSVGGYSIGDPRSKFDGVLVRELSPGHLRHMNGCDYGIQDGKVATIAITDETLLATLDIRTRDDVERVFGPADVRKDKHFGIVTYEFHQRGLAVVWANKVTGVVIRG